MKIHQLHAFDDNFIFVVEKNEKAMVVDPGEADAVIKFLSEKNLKLEIILLTHCHQDHIGGVKQLIQRYRDVKVLGPSRLVDFNISPDQILGDSKTFEFEQTYWQCFALPGHTLDHLGYYDAQKKVLFCGDVLFSLGCGRLFEGSFEQGYQSLQKIKSLDPETQVYCAHEYTLANCNFHIDAKIAPTQEYLELKSLIRERLSRNEDTIPTKLDFELKNNAFLIAQSLEEFTELRLKRNKFVNREEK